MTGRNRTMLAMMLLALGVAGCGGEQSPVAPTGTQLPASGTVPPGTTTGVPSTVQGFVVDTAFRPLGGARIEAGGGPQASAAATSDRDGRFVLTGSFDRTTPFRASKAGYVDETRTLETSSTTGAPLIIFYLQPVGPPADIAGEYDVMLTVDSTCSDLPLESRTLSHAATIARRPDRNIPASSYFTVTVEGASPAIRQSFSPIGVAGEDLGFDLSQNHDGRPTFVEQLAPNTYLAFLPTDGLAATAMSAGGRTFSTTFDGAVEYCVLKGEMEGAYECSPTRAVTRVRCESHQHQIAFTRR